ncbi:GDP-6-deoxy-D-mannose reductase [Moorella thermoacetica]|uniref:GDP-6-deoxy-D-mannose reductase n=1 Tax=Neomoorella thermoacetica TaxID=1525 RepID=A0A1J5JFH2_NEOTH|nr:GDP-mannose 4,6-dehydratase [Moorella thermoacetica]OIQ07949.1 GDP-6-deoxy-D-mannose reductase [Moorella thermoacetica]
MRALVTGAAGFVGHYLVKLLLEKGYTVCATYHRRLPNNLLFEKTDLKQVDITDKESLRSLFYEFLPDEIYHLAGIAVTTGIEPKEYYRVNFYGTLNLFEVVREAAPQARMLYVSSAAAYGPVPTEKQPIGEDMPLKPVNHYAASKAAADVVASAYAAQGLCIVRARPFNHTGAGQTTDYVCSRLAKEVAEVALGRTKAVLTAGNLDAARDFTDVRDVVRAYWLLLQKGRPGEAYNVCSGKVYSVREIAETLAAIGEVDITLQSLPELQRRTDIPLLLGSAEKIGYDTGWQPDIPFKQTLADLLDWWKGKLEA